MTFTRLPYARNVRKTAEPRVVLTMDENQALELLGALNEAKIDADAHPGRQHHIDAIRETLAIALHRMPPSITPVRVETGNGEPDLYRIGRRAFWADTSKRVTWSAIATDSDAVDVLRAVLSRNDLTVFDVDECREVVVRTGECLDA